MFECHYLILIPFERNVRIGPFIKTNSPEIQYITRTDGCLDFYFSTIFSISILICEYVQYKCVVVLLHILSTSLCSLFVYCDNIFLFIYRGFLLSLLFDICIYFCLSVYLSFLFEYWLSFV